MDRISGAPFLSVLGLASTALGAGAASGFSAGAAAFFFLLRTTTRITTATTAAAAPPIRATGRPDPP